MISSSTTITIDFETTYSTHHTLTKMTYPEYINDPRFKVFGMGIHISSTTTYIHTDNIQQYLDKLFVPDNDIILVCHNTMFDAAILSLYYHCIPPREYRDTQLFSAFLWPGNSVSHSLAALIRRVNPAHRKTTELFNTKNLDTLTTAQAHELKKYCINDVNITMVCYNQLLPHIPSKELELMDLTLRMYNEPHLVLDRPRTKRALTAEILYRNKLLDNAPITRAQLASNNKYAAYLESLGIEVPTKISPITEKLTYALAKNDIEYQQLQYDNPDLQPLWDARQAVKSRLNETRAQRFLDTADPVTNLMPVPLKYYGARTGRYSASQKINMQNLPSRGKSRELRHCLTAPTGYKLIVADSAQIEARVLAWVAGQDNIVSAFTKGTDVYKVAASGIYKKDIDTITKQERFVGKTATLGLGYGAGWKKFRDMLKSGAMGPKMDLSDTQAKDIVYGWRESNGAIVNFWGTMGTAIELMQTVTEEEPLLNCKGILSVRPNQLVTPGGLSLWYPDLTTIYPDNSYDYPEVTYGNSKTRYRIYSGKMAENCVQHLARNVVMYQMLDISKLPDTIVVGTVHDEVLALVPEELAEERLNQMIEIMRTPPSWAPDLPLDAEGDIADNYGDAK